MDRYADGYVLVVPTAELDAYREMAAEAGELWIEHGALEYFEGVGDDMEPDGDGTSMRTFPQLAGTGDDETVVFSFVVFESRERRDEVNAKVMDDPAMDPNRPDVEMPFDPERMTYGGFRSIVSYEHTS
ncbi:DUF1428 domain-containing protein [Halorarum halobium]|uniref:DUF1428 domain-containing protein n=1 Tax=Halorarum halobium TaxID=3075121 RepID=UPI0028A6339B|nr:DUF1428 domain-containing protein [Halobaculum sp. XH14]